MNLTILNTTLFKATHSIIGDELMAEPFRLDINRPAISNGAVRGFYVEDNNCSVFELDMICEAIEFGFATKGYVTLEAFPAPVYRYVEHGRGEYQVLDPEGYDVIGEYVTLADARRTCNKYNRQLLTSIN